MEMKSIISFLFLLQAFIDILNFATAQFPENPVFKCREIGNYTTRTDFARNLNLATNTMINSIPAAIHDGFYNSSWGVNEAVIAVALCASVGVKSGMCKECVQKLSNMFIIHCPDQKEAVVWGANCMVRYSGQKILGVLDDWVWLRLPDQERTTSDGFDRAMTELANKLRGQAAGGTSKKFATGTITFSSHKTTVYSAMQCTPDLSKELCTECLSNLLMSIRKCCAGRTSGRMFSPNCYFRWSLQDFFKWKPPPAATLNFLQ